jgi:pimeloyl-ACP methyl ester carboxylesterase
MRRRNVETGDYPLSEGETNMARCTLLAGSMTRHVRWVLLTCAVLMLLPIHANAVLANSDAKSLEPTTEEVTFANERDVLAGTLYLPRDVEPCPAVVLLTGSNRGARGPLLARIAQHFARNGIAVLHYDSAGTGKSTGNTLLQSRADRAREAASAVRFLGTKRGIDPQHIGLWGGSEGASIALLAAAMYPREVSFAIPVSGGVGVGGGSVFEQMYHAAECFAVDHNLTLDEMRKIVTFEQLSYVFLTGLNILEWPLIEARVKRWPEEPWAEFIQISRMRIRSGTLTREEKQTVTRLLRQVMSTFIGAKWSKLKAFQKEQIKLIMSMDTRQLFAFLDTPRLAEDWDWDLRRKAEKVKCPVLGICGEDDREVPPNLIATRLREYLSEVNNGDFEVSVIPGADHVLAKTGSGSNGDFIPGYLEKMTAWIRAHTAGTGSKEGTQSR